MNTFPEKYERDCLSLVLSVLINYNNSLQLTFGCELPHFSMLIDNLDHLPFTQDLCLIAQAADGQFDKNDKNKVHIIQSTCQSVCNKLFCNLVTGYTQYENREDFLENHPVGQMISKAMDWARQ